MPSEATDERYLNWLYGQVAPVRESRRTWRSLFKQMHRTIFVAIVAHDENRIADARDLRYEFLAECEDEQGDLEWMEAPCSMLELLVILARQLSFELDEPVDFWFWHLVKTLEFEQFHDRNYNDNVQALVSETLDRIVWRTYLPSGRGGLFPLQHPDRDQRKVELWYQLNAYLLEHF